MNPNGTHRESQDVEGLRRLLAEERAHSRHLEQCLDLARQGHAKEVGFGVALVLIEERLVKDWEERLVLAQQRLNQIRACCPDDSTAQRLAETALYEVEVVLGALPATEKENP